MLTLDDVRHCLEGATPGVVATCALDGTPNVAYLSQVEYLDAEHLALSWQFFTRTRRNVLENPRAQVMLVDPRTAARFRVDVEYRETLTQGPLFERMRARLASLASHQGMAKVFRLQGADVYRVRAIACVHGRPSRPESSRGGLVALRRASSMLAAAATPSELVTVTLQALQKHFDVAHAMVWWADPQRRRLAVLGSIGATAQGVGAELDFGDGVVGVCAEHGTPIRVTFGMADTAYSRVVRGGLSQAGVSFEREVPYPGLEAPQSQLAVPLLFAGVVRGVLFVESPEPMRFGFDDEDALVTLAQQLAPALFATAPDDDEPGDGKPGVEAPRGAPIVVRHYAADDSVFLDGEYLIKGVAGRILWLMAQRWAETGRAAFSNRELRLDPRLQLPVGADNLEARLLLLQRRLEERQGGVLLGRPARGRVELQVSRPLTLESV